MSKGEKEEKSDTVDDFKSKVDLNNLINESEREGFEERVSGVRQKVKLVLQGVADARNNVLKKEKELAEVRKTYERGLNKLDQLRKGNWNILDQKDDSQQDKKEESQ